MLETPRLVLRQWQQSDLAAFAQLNADAQVMRYFPSQLSRSQSDAIAQRLAQHIEEHGFGLWALELKTQRQFIGFVGLQSQAQDSGLPQAPLVEIAWRLAAAYWRQGLVFEAASASLSFAFEQLHLDKVHAFTALSNRPSWLLMQKLGMHNCQQDFDHPKLAPTHPLSRHCLYQISADDWRNRRANTD